MNRTVIRGGLVVSMVDGRPDAVAEDILIEGDRIVAVGPDLDAHDAEAVDATGRIIIPGLVNAHLHTWQTALRGVAADWTLLEYVHWMHVELASHYTPDDIEAGTLAGALNQIACGTTTLGDWCHNNRTSAHTDAAIAGLRRAGIRAVFFHGTPKLDAKGEEVEQADTPQSREEIKRLMRGPFASRDQLLTLGMAIAGPQYAARDVALADLRLARDMGLPVSMHHSGGPAYSVDGWDRAEAEGLLGSRVNIVHGNEIDDDQLRRFVDLGVSFTVTPEVELGSGHGDPISGRLTALGSAPSPGVDIESAVGGDMLTVARMAMAHQRALDHRRARQTTGMMSMALTVTSRDALAWATVHGARALGLQDRVGTIEAGKQADLVFIDTRALNLWPVNNPIAAVLQASQANIEAVMIGGAWRKRYGALLHPDIDALRARLADSARRIRAKVAMPPAGS